MAEARYRVVPRMSQPAHTKPLPALTVNLKPLTEQANSRYLMEVFLTSLALGYVFDVLFFGHALGISVPLFATLFVTGLIGTMRLRGLTVAWRNLWLLAPLFFFAAMVPFRANAQLTLLNVGMVLIITALLVFFVAAGRSWEPSILSYPVAVGTVAKEMLVAPIPAIGTARKARASSGRSLNLVPVLRGLVLALPVLIVFGALLASADKFFAQLVSDIFRLKVVDNFGEMMWRIVIGLIVAWGVAGALLFASLRGSEQEDKRVASRLRFRPLVGATEGATILVLVNALFAVFAWLQFVNIFLARPSTVDYEAYREYIRRGFGELLLVCVLTLLLILTVRRLADFNTTRTLLIYRILSTMAVLFTGVMLLSATERMRVWQEVMFYINTPLRIYVSVFIVWLAILFGWLLLTVWMGRVRFGIGALLAAIGFLATVNYINPDANVAAHNLARQDELSTRYLFLLSEDAVPVLAQSLDTLSDPVVKAHVREHLAQRLDSMEWKRRYESWPSLHFSRSEAYNTLKSLEANGKLFYTSTRTPTSRYE